jgi:Lsr2
MVVELTSDLDGAPADETVSFALDGTTLEIDLTSAQAEEFRATLKRYAERGRRLTPTGKAYVRKPVRPDNEVIRRWADQNRIPCPKRGRIPARVKDMYDQAKANGDPFGDGGNQKDRTGPVAPQAAVTNVVPVQFQAG